ncbi:hypothetical protein [Streptomyces sp. IBSBF 2806]|uniref:hypothetical protein n=1 Tax=Streptomyces sp. IBSBF 2806 TaxID=2903529 RepID=UPI002FDBEBF8
MRLTETARRLDLDNRDLPIDHGQDEEEELARMLIAAAWYQSLARTPIGFAFTPLANAALENPGAFTLTRLLELPDRALVADVTAQLHKAAQGPLEALRARTGPEDCVGRADVRRRPDHGRHRPRRRRPAARLQERPPPAGGDVPARGVAADRLPAPRCR